MKQCSQCKQWKDESEYYNYSKSKDGLNTRCKACIKIYQQREDVKERNKKIGHEYYLKVKETDEYKKKAEAYRERKLELNTKWREANKEHMKKYAEENKERNYARNKVRKEQLKQYNQEHQEELETKYPTKVCSMCKHELKRVNFNIDNTSLDGLSYWCKSCQHSYNINRREKIRQIGRERYNSEKAMKYYYDNKGKLKQSIKEKIQKRRETDPKYVIDHTMQNLLNSILKVKRQNSPILLERCGYTAQQLLNHIEFQFTPEMSWGNYGSYWEVDHIKPKYSFNYVSYDDEQFKECWALSNLRPLSVKENQSRNKI